MADRFVVTGCARSGTGYIAVLLQVLGIECAHEGVFGSGQVLRGEPLRWFELDGDSSWLAVPLLPRPDLVVGHQTRAPLAVIRSLVGMRLFAEPPVYEAHEPHRLVVASTMPAVVAEETEVDRAARYWLEWNRKAREHAGRSWRVEDLADVDAALEVVRFLGYDARDVMAEAIAAVPTDYNSTTLEFMRRDESVTWGDIRPGLREAIEELAAEFGYLRVGAESSSGGS